MAPNDMPHRNISFLFEPAWRRKNAMPAEIEKQPTSNTQFTGKHTDIQKKKKGEETHSEAFFF